jgi:hypothetical protein
MWMKGAGYQYLVSDNIMRAITFNPLEIYFEKEGEWHVGMYSLSFQLTLDDSSITITKIQKTLFCWYAG